MKKAEIFRGVATALITPFRDGEIDYPTLEKLIERQIDAGIDALVIGGTTAEAATLSDEERYELFRRSREYIDGRCKLILGTGTNDTRIAVKHTEYASNLGCDGVLVVTPYYNRGTKDGVVKHYETIAKASGVPVLLYNVPSRTGVNLSIETLEELSENERIVGIKEASDSLDRLVAISGIDGLALYSGNDSQIYPTLSLGGLGVISVVSNLYPRETADICKYFFANNRNKSLETQRKLLSVINALFLETNPAPVKYAMSKKGLCLADMRLPMWLPTKVTRDKIDRVIRAFEG
ncbi:MAG: 4-hydroxy-tetrahydrodipicolinate synthase [Clostridia bacterium]|nr:4-hydroxy-tetrahydrodipicolinate synthase [Clostridia bacterium]MBQ7391008.1 4-hydroxy-tetrahydrodipicolinate synthase [Clostridia bacterium]